MQCKLEIFKDPSGITSGYNVLNVDNGEIILSGDGYENEDLIITELSELNEALRSIFG
jgi:uncharacterized protein YegP (UPF0339 family)